MTQGCHHVRRPVVAAQAHGLDPVAAAAQPLGDPSQHQGPCQALREVGGYLPPVPERLHDTRPGRPRVIQSCDVFVDRDAVMYVTDYNAGLSVLQYERSSS
jgi:hypothetical protein